jgi:hypothetical protein
MTLYSSVLLLSDDRDLLRYLQGSKMCADHDVIELQIPMTVQVNT